MTNYAWPQTWMPDAFEMRVVPNAFTFTSLYSKTTQTIDFLGERWAAVVELPPDSSIQNEILGAAREAFFDRLRGPVNLISMWNLKRPVPLGTLRDGGLTGIVKNASNVTVSVVNASAAAVTVVYGTPTVRVLAPQLSGTTTLTAVVGYTLRAGDHIGIGGQMVRIMADAVADAAGSMPIEFLPRIRGSAWQVGSIVTWNKPTANFMLKAEGVPVTWRPGMFEGSSLELIEAF